MQEKGPASDRKMAAEKKNWLPTHFICFPVWRYKENTFIRFGFCFLWPFFSQPLCVAFAVLPEMSVKRYCGLSKKMRLKKVEEKGEILSIKNILWLYFSHHEELRKRQLTPWQLYLSKAFCSFFIRLNTLVRFFCCLFGCGDKMEVKKGCKNYDLIGGE